jgi:hypothetical protein
LTVSADALAGPFFNSITPPMMPATAAIASTPPMIASFILGRLAAGSPAPSSDSGLDLAAGFSFSLPFSFSLSFSLSFSF